MMGIKILMNLKKHDFKYHSKWCTKKFKQAENLLIHLQIIQKNENVSKYCQISIKVIKLNKKSSKMP